MPYRFDGTVHDVAPYHLFRPAVVLAHSCLQMDTHKKIDPAMYLEPYTRVIHLSLSSHDPP